MIRLVQQFDMPRTRAQVAAPKSAIGCCSCCCSCLATLVSTTVLTARALDSQVPKVKQKEEALPTEIEGFEPPAPAPASNEFSLKPLPTTSRYLGALLLPVGLILSLMTLAFVPPVAPVFYVLAIYILHRLGASAGWLILLALGFPVVMLLEMVAWMVLGNFK